MGKSDTRTVAHYHGYAPDRLVSYDIYQQKMESQYWGFPVEADHFFENRETLYEKVATVRLRADTVAPLERVFERLQNDYWTMKVTEAEYEAIAHAHNDRFSWTFVGQDILAGEGITAHTADPKRSLMVGDAVVCPELEIAWQVDRFGYKEIK